MDQLAAWLPAALMMLFALGTWWLVRSTEALRVPGIERPVLHEPDYDMRDFTVRNFDGDGRLKSELTGTQGHHYPDTDTYEMSQPRVRAYDAQGQLTIGRAERGVSNGDGSEIQLYGDAHVLRGAGVAADGRATPRLEFRGPYLQAWPEARRVHSDQPVELLRGVDRFTGDALDYDAQSGVAELRGNVRGLIRPAPARP
ncbi:MAG TPA: LPS export ABC transporter periplasmic protein LptC [Ottowia sp.]|uniref:LPS export ABC transporter periplasmic protein LptC n=1 Tax=Ottowia sp. TaxID=1898956 RepID=UPI002C37D84E|nr:LPS export ABC transporter periplasmic protein LptC [Ottowia sp.]HMN21777.1 LPS export ABC transporter periplasmic protein LptC [Ottowia sp.]